MIKYKILLFSTIVATYLITLYGEYKSLDRSKRVYLKDLNISIIDIKDGVAIDLESIAHSTFKDWDLKKSATLIRREKSIRKLNRQENSKSPKNRNFKIKNRVICLERECWEFVGIIKVGNRVAVTLLSKRKNSKLETFKIGDYLLENLKIVAIKGDYITLIDTKKGKRFSLRLFDVDISKYRPKRIKANIKELN